MSQQWQQRRKPARLEGRYEFGDYSQVREFLERAAELSEREGLYPDLGFGKNYVNVTIYADDPDADPDSQRGFARKLDELAETQTH